ncbi:MAG TPA: hypothetical protein VFF37_06640 [Streptomyces sp.]|nr:hypothetical protein [Streptomyces sp.]
MTPPFIAPPRPLASAELDALAVLVSDALEGQTLVWADAGVRWAVGRPRHGGDHVLVAVRADGADGLAYAHVACEAWARILAEAGLVPELRMRGRYPVGLLVRPRVQLTPDQLLYAAVATRRRELGLTWQVMGGQAGLTRSQLTRLRNRSVTWKSRGPLKAWLEEHRHTPQPPPPHRPRKRKAPNDGAPHLR